MRRRARAWFHAGLLAVACFGCSKGQRDAPDASNGSGPMRCLTMFTPPVDGPMTCIEYRGAAWAQLDEKVRSQCQALGGAMTAETCPQERAWGYCTDPTVGGSEARRYAYRRIGAPKGGDLESEAEARESCPKSSVWTSSAAAH